MGKIRDFKVFTAGVESTQRVESINGVLKKHLDRGTLLKESNPSTGLPSTYNMIFKNIDSILKDHLASILLSLQQAQIKQSLLYQGILILIDQVKESDNEQSNGNKDYTTKALYYIDQIRSANVYTSNIKERVNKKIEFDSIISVVKTSVQVAVAEGVASELIRLLTQFIMKYRHNTRLNIEEVHFISHFNNEIQESFYNYQRQPLVVVEERNIPEISNPEYHKPKGRFPK
ncbi:hypothetical protein GLOIN_2v1773736 [Rhizophagus irregularis DAOM 181602=DAOM 197198]|nr:hypothetical protein GLOIN_2v1773736 [Rhizophagus irregularis DAOM 181602=DAOM 197198]CAB5186953.1 unnamed protein product [Rhizophagus irregularis]